MLKKTITYTDYAGNVRTEDHYFHLNKAEVVKWLSTSGGYTLDKLLERLASEENAREIINIFDELIHTAYGRQSLDGRKFEKSEEIWKNFLETEAYSQLFLEIIGDAKAAAAFVNGIIPQDMADEIAKIVADNPEGIPAEVKDYLLAN